MLYNSYLDPGSVKSTCREYKTYLQNENDVYRSLQTFYTTGIRKLSTYFEGEAMDAIEAVAGTIEPYLNYLIEANEEDISDIDAFISLVGDEKLEGSVILTGKSNAYSSWQSNRNSASSCYEKMYKATDSDMEAYWRSQADNYNNLASDAWDLYDFYCKKEEKYDEINAASGLLFQNAKEKRTLTDSKLDAYKDYCPGGVFDTSAFETVTISRNSDEETLLDNTDMSMEEIYELISLQHAPEGSLPPEAQARLAELEAMLLSSNPAAWALYTNHVGDLNANVRRLMGDLAGAGYFEEFVYTGGKSSAESNIDQLKFMEELLAADPTGPYSNYYRNQIEILKKSLENYCTTTIGNAEHSEEYAAAYNYLLQNGYTIDELAGIVIYWESIDGGDITGIEMPPEWCETHLVLPDNIQITEENCLDMENSEELIQWYYDGFFVLELMSGQPYANEGEGISSYQFRNYVNDSANLPTQFNDLYHNWYDYVYGGMCDYKAGINSVRATKYAMGEYIFPFVDYASQDYYHAQTNDEDTLYLFSINAYITDSGRAEEYYTNFRFEGSIKDREAQILKYIRDDIANGNIKSIEDYTDTEIMLFMAEYNSTTGTELGCPDFISMDDLAYLLEQELEGCGIRSYRIEGNTLYIMFEGDDYGNGYSFPDQELAFSFDVAVDAFGTKYVSIQEFSTIAAQVAVQQVEGGFYLSDLSRADLEKNAIAILCQTGGFTEEQLMNLPEDELNQLLITTEEIILADRMTQRVVSGRMRVVEGTYECGKIVLETVSKLITFASLVCPGVGAIAIAGEAASLADFGWEAYYGEAELSDLKDVAMSLINIGGEVYSDEALGEFLSLLSTVEGYTENTITIAGSFDFENHEFVINGDTASAFKDIVTSLDYEKIKEEIVYNMPVKK